MLVYFPKPKGATREKTKSYMWLQSCLWANRKLYLQNKTTIRMIDKLKNFVKMTDSNKFSILLIES